MKIDDRIGGIPVYQIGQYRVTVVQNRNILVEKWVPECYTHWGSRFRKGHWRLGVRGKELSRVLAELRTQLTAERIEQLRAELEQIERWNKR